MAVGRVPLRSAVSSPAHNSKWGFLCPGDEYPGCIGQGRSLARVTGVFWVYLLNSTKLKETVMGFFGQFAPQSNWVGRMCAHRSCCSSQMWYWLFTFRARFNYTTGVTGFGIIFKIGRNESCWIWIQMGSGDVSRKSIRSLHLPLTHCTHFDTLLAWDLCDISH